MLRAAESQTDPAPPLPTPAHPKRTKKWDKTSNALPSESCSLLPGSVDSGPVCQREQIFYPGSEARAVPSLIHTSADF